MIIIIIIIIICESQMWNTKASKDYTKASKDSSICIGTRHIQK